MAEVAILDDRKTGITNVSWRADAKRLNNTKFIISKKKGTVYMHDGINVTADGRINFKHLYKASPEIQQKKHKNFRDGKVRKLEEQAPVRYFDALD